MKTPFQPRRRNRKMTEEKRESPRVEAMEREQEAPKRKRGRPRKER